VQATARQASSLPAGEEAGQGRREPPLRIAFVSPRFHTTVLGGAELLARWFAERLSLAGHRVEVFTTCALDSVTWQNALRPGDEQHGGCLVHRYPVDRADPRARGEIEQRIRLGQRLSLEEEERWLRAGVASAAMEEELSRRGREFDAVVGLPYLVGTTYFAFRAVPDRFFLLPCLHDEAFARMSATSLMLAQARGVLFNSVPERDLAQRINPGLARSAVVGVGFDPPVTVDPDAFRAKYEVPGPFAVFVGRLEVDKNVPQLIRYFRRYAERRASRLELILVGDGDVQVPTDGPVRKLSIEWGDRDSMLGAALLLFQPSLKESFSIVMMQAWLSQTPVLADARSEVAAYHCQRSNGGLWFANYPEFEELVDRLEKDDGLRRGLGANGREYVRCEYAWPRVLERLERALRDWGAGGDG
jgi:glycosyltransferase involved in cell wall biosynthesis